MWKWLLPTLTGVGGFGAGFAVGTQFPTANAANRKLEAVRAKQARTTSTDREELATAEGGRRK